MHPLASDGRDWYTIQEAASVLGYSQASVRAMLDEGELVARQRKRGAQVRVLKVSVEKVLAKRRGPDEEGDRRRKGAA